MKKDFKWAKDPDLLIEFLDESDNLKKFRNGVYLPLWKTELLFNNGVP